MNLNEISVPCDKCKQEYNEDFFLNICKQHHYAFIPDNGFYKLNFICPACQNQIKTTFDSEFSNRIRETIRDTAKNAAYDPLKPDLDESVIDHPCDDETDLPESNTLNHESNSNPVYTKSADGLFLISSADDESYEDSFIEDEPDFSDFENEQFDQDMDEDELYDNHFDPVEEGESTKCAQAKSDNNTEPVLAKAEAKEDSVSKIELFKNETRATRLLHPASNLKAKYNGSPDICQEVDKNILTSTIE